MQKVETGAALRSRDAVLGLPDRLSFAQTLLARDPSPRLMASEEVARLEEDLASTEGNEIAILHTETANDTPRRAKHRCA